LNNNLIYNHFFIFLATGLSSSSIFSSISFGCSISLGSIPLGSSYNLSAKSIFKGWWIFGNRYFGVYNSTFTKVNLLLIAY